MSHVHAPSADSPAAQIAAVAFSENGQKFPKTAALLVEWILDGKIDHQAASRALEAVALDYAQYHARTGKGAAMPGAAMSAAVNKLNG